MTDNWLVLTPKVRQELPHFAHLYDAVKNFNLPKFTGARVPVTYGLDIPNWVHLLTNCHENEICHFLQFGWPLGYFSDKVPESVNKNHPTALAHLTHINDFIDTKLGFGALVGQVEQPFYSML